MEKIDFRKNYVIVLDTETANGLDDPLFYDLGFIVMDTQGNICERFSLVNKDIFLGERELMKSAYYANKLPNYWKEIWSGERQVMTTYEIKKLIAEMVEKYHVTAIMAHNARFDYCSCNTTQRFVTKSKYRYFFPYGVEIWDTMKMAETLICQMPTYIKFCEDNGYLTKDGKVRKTAEILFRFISKENDFEEAHTGLADVMIEKEIFLYCKRQHKHFEKVLYARH